jgi:hypothetical protein
MSQTMYRQAVESVVVDWAGFRPAMKEIHRRLEVAIAE